MIRMLLGVIVLLSTVRLQAQSEREINLADSLSEVLSEVCTSADSLRLLTDIYDLRPRGMRDSIGRMLLHTAIVAGDDAVGLDVLRNQANLHVKNDSLLELDLQTVSMFPDSEDRKETETFVRMLINVHKARYSSEAENERQLRQLLRDVNSGKAEDVYDEIVMLHAICIYMGQSTQGNLLSKYMDRLGQELDRLRPEAYALKNCYYVMASLCYAANGDGEKAIAADRELLKVIDGLECGTIGTLRKYRNYDGNKYVIYSRLLSNYPLLSDADTERYYRNTMAIVARDSLASTTNRISMRPQIYYAMYKEDYAASLELLKRFVNEPYNANERKNLLKLMLECSEKTGDDSAYLWASKEYIRQLETQLEDRTRDEYKELQIVYDINRMRAGYARVSLQMQRTIMIGAIVAAIVLFVLLLVVIVLWRHSRKLTVDLKQSNETLRQERDNLRQAQGELVKARDEARLASRVKSDFIKNMSGEVAVPVHTINEYTNLIIDCSEAGVKPYLKRFADLVALNSELLTSIVNDVLNLSEIDSNAVSVSLRKESLASVCNMAVDSVRHRVRSGVEIYVEPGLSDITLNTDSKRLMQILVQLLSNAVKFTVNGKIEVSYLVDAEAGVVTISVTDTGIGVPSDCQERIFERFVKLDKTAQGVGIGLPIARCLARKLGGGLEIDGGYTDGARFVVTLPLE